MWTKEKFTDPKQNFWIDLLVGGEQINVNHTL